MANVSSIMVGRFLRLPRRSADTWQGGLIRMPVWVDEPGGTARRPWGAMWVSLETGLVNGKLEAEGTPPDWTLALEAMLELGLKFAQTRPARIEVADQELGDRIVGALGDRELAVAVSRDIPAARAMASRMGTDFNGRPSIPGALDARGVTVERMRAFAAAAREFYKAAPWRHLSDEDLIQVEEPAVAKGLGHVTVLGAAGQTFGLGFFGSRKDFEAVLEGEDPGPLLGRRGTWHVSYGPPWDMPFSDHDLWEDHGLPVAGEAAYPVALWVGPTGDTRRPGAQELADIGAILRALARTSEDEIDRGRWGHTVSTHDGERTVTLSIPDLLEPLDAPPDRRCRGLLDRRAMERVTLEIERFTAAREFANEEELNAAIQARFMGPLDAIPSTAGTPLEQAQDLVYRAFEARGRRRIQLARKALDLSRDCADAYTLLAESTGDERRARDLYAEAVAAGERALGPSAFAEDAGHFWGIVRTRPYMRARFGLAQTLEGLGERDAAIEHYRELLRLNPGDNQGVRYVLLAALMLARRDEEAGTLLEQHGDEPAAVWTFGRALLAFRREGDSPAARAHLQAAIRLNRHAPRYLTGDREWEGALPSSYAFGSEEEAIICEAELGEAWSATPGAEEWLAASARGGKDRRRRRRPGSR
jgi:tetratricopeptide (TPR) repeat protein